MPAPADFRSEGMSSQGALIEVEDKGAAGTTITATAVSKAAPAVVTAANSNTVDGDVVTATVSTMPSLNGNTYVVNSTGAGSFELVGSDASKEASAATSGTFAPVSWLPLCEAKTFSGFDGQASELDITTLCSRAKEYRLGLQDYGSFTFTMNLVPGDPAQIELEVAKADGSPRWFRVTLPEDSGVYVFQAYVRQKTITGGVDTALTSNVTLRITGTPTFVAPASSGTFAETGPQPEQQRYKEAA